EMAHGTECPDLCSEHQNSEDELALQSLVHRRKRTLHAVAKRSPWRWSHAALGLALRAINSPSKIKIPPASSTADGISFRNNIARMLEPIGSKSRASETIRAGKSVSALFIDV